MNGFLQDLRYALRQSLKTPTLSAVIVITITLGVGVNTIRFPVVNGVLLNPLPYPQSQGISDAGAALRVRTCI